MSWTCLVRDSKAAAGSGWAEGFLRGEEDLAAGFGGDLGDSLAVVRNAAARAGFGRLATGFTELRAEDLAAGVWVRFMRFSGATAARR